MNDVLIGKPIKISAIESAAKKYKNYKRYWEYLNMYTKHCSFKINVKLYK